MSFIDMKDPKKGDAIVVDYLANVRRIQLRNLNEKAKDLARQEDVRNLFNPVAESTKKSTTESWHRCETKCEILMISSSSSNKGYKRTKNGRG